MASIASILPLVQIITSILIVGGVLLQTRGAGLSAFQDSANQTFYKRRGGELFLFRATIVLGILFVATSLVSLIIR